MQSLDLSIVAPYSELLATGLWWTVVLFLSSSVLSLMLGVVFALIVLYAPRVAALPVRFITWLLMGTPLLLQLYVIYYGLVQVGIDIPALVAGIIGLSLHFAVYNADVIRAGVMSVDPGQIEGARSIGLSRGQTQRYVIVPQALRSTIAPLGNNLIVLLKDTSLVSIIGIAELVYSAQRAVSETYSPFEFYLTVGVIYYAVNLVLEAGLHLLENKVEMSR
ncbi:amino acid ABC transporter permease [Pseudomonas sp. TH05]|uniref:amino acid ABC transporter permease n=1 Tax=unclassified Pseudomonas TaxID=196821 RepID=UPI001912CEE2|nr:MULTISPECIES: amino acid ABC transporter permease [unclassified Pseudomonas]MBK5538454.1 amino acid ABC transporter permease [Pseudomonas sp. TH07]MBK5557733.1 amino acid ABC transporter permease [Pseudomonas sp. TH05]